LNYLCISSYFFSLYVNHPDLHSFPTRRSSDLEPEIAFSHAFPQGDIISVHRDIEKTVREIARYSLKDAETWRALMNRFQCRDGRSEEHTSELQSRGHLVCRLLLEKKKYKKSEQSTQETPSDYLSTHLSVPQLSNVPQKR